MIKNLQKKMKEQKGFTLIELLAVIVILGIISAIAVPSILNIIDNTKRDAHAANAEQMKSATKLAVTSNTTLQTGVHYLTLEYLESESYLDKVNDPDGEGYLRVNMTATPTTNDTLPTTEPGQFSYAVVSGGKVTYVKLVNNTRGVQVKTSNKAVDASNTIKRADVNPTVAP